MKKSLLLLWVALFANSLSGHACTSLLAGKNATVDGSTMITYAADSHTLYGELYYWPAATYPKGTMLDVYDWETGKFSGRIPQVERTYKVVGYINEHQLSISETTFGGRPELVDTTGIIDYGSLIHITLQRAKTAREAIEVMTDLVKKYGYRSEGESFSIADPNEIWIMDMIGKGANNKGAVWVAVRIPDDCIAAHANHARIHTFPLDRKNKDCLYAPDVISFAREKGYFDGLNKDFSFSKAYAPADFGSIRHCEARVWSFYNRFSPETGKSYLPTIKGGSDEPLPLYIRPDRKVSVQDFKDMMRDHFEGTPFDMTTDAGAGPFHVPYRFRPLTFQVDSATYTNERAIATQQTAFSFVSQMRSWLPDAVGGVIWFGVDDANTSVYIPLYCSIDEVPECFRQGNGDLLHFSWTSAFWIHNWVANMAYARYSHLIGDIRSVQQELESDFNAMQNAVDRTAVELLEKDKTAALKYLTNYSCQQAERSTACWKKLGEYLLVKYIDGNTKKEKDGRFLDNGFGQAVSPDFPGYSEEFYRQIVKDAGEKLKVDF